MREDYNIQMQNCQIDITDMCDVLMPIAQKLVDIHSDIEAVDIEVTADNLRHATQDLLTFCERMLAQAKLSQPRLVDTCTEYGLVDVNAPSRGWEVL